MNQPLAQRILDIIYKDSAVRRGFKDSLSDWILDTQSRSAPLSESALLQYLAAYQPDVLERLKINVYIAEDVTRALDRSNPN